MTKTILYTTNPDCVESFESVKNCAIVNGKLFTCVAKKGSDLYSAKESAHIVTKKGNDAYIIESVEGVVDYLEAKKSNITGIISIDYPFGEPDGDMLDDFKDCFAFNKVNDIKMTIKGDICVRTVNGYVSINDDGELVRYPKAFIIDIPMYVMPKPKREVKKGDIVVTDDGYAKVLSVKDKKIVTILYKGAMKTVCPINDFFMNESYIQVVISPMSQISTNGINPMMLALSSGNSDLLPLLMMQQQNCGINPMMLLAMKKDNSDIMKTMLMMQMFNNQPATPTAEKPTETATEIEE